MYIDIGIAAIIVIFAILGLLSGFWGQILRLIALISLFFIAPPVARAIQGPVGDILGTSSSEAMIWGTSLIVAAVLLYIGLSIIIAIILHAAKAYKDMSGTNRVAGMFLGLLKGLVLTYLLACGFAMVNQAGHFSGTVEQQASESHVVAMVMKFNMVERLGYDLEGIVTSITPGEEGETTGAPEGTVESGEAPAEGQQQPNPPTGVPANQPVLPTGQIPSAPSGQSTPVAPTTPPSQGFQAVPSPPSNQPPTAVQPSATPSAPQPPKDQ